MGVGVNPLKFRKISSKRRPRSGTEQVYSGIAPFIQPEELGAGCRVGKVYLKDRIRARKDETIDAETDVPVNFAHHTGWNLMVGRASPPAILKISGRRRL